MTVTDDMVGRFIEALWGASLSCDEFRAAAVVKGSRTHEAVRRALKAALNEDKDKMIMHHHRPGDTQEGSGP